LEVWKRLLAFAEVFSDSVETRPLQPSDAIKHGRSWWERLKQRLAYWLFARLDPELAALKSQAWHLRKDPFVRRVKRARRANLRNT